MKKRESTTPEQDGGGARRGARQQPVKRDGGATVLQSDDIVSNAVAKREAESRRLEEQMAEGGHLATGIGDDRVGGRGDEVTGKE
jgi:hypothetical protein